MTAANVALQLDSLKRRSRFSVVYQHLLVEFIVRGVAMKYQLDKSFFLQDDCCVMGE